MAAAKQPALGNVTIPTNSHPTPIKQVAEYMGPGTTFGAPVHVAHDEPWERRDLLGVHPQKQVGRKL